MISTVKPNQLELHETAAVVRQRPPLQFGPLTLKTRYLLSPLARYTNLSFRRLIREVGGVGLCTTDLVNARALLEQTRKSLELVETTPDDSPFAVQIFGKDAGEMRAAAQWLERERRVDSIDINMGCPVQKVTKVGAGANLMCSPDETIKLVHQVVEGVQVPVTVKMRLGWDDSQLTAPCFAREFEQVGVKAVMIHGRTRAQGFGGSVNRDGIRQVVEAVDRIPVIGNGDVKTVADAARMFRETGCHGVSVGRGALANPWIFRQLDQWERTGEFDPAGDFSARMQLLLRQVEFLLEQHQSEEYALIQFRRTVHWYLKGMRVRGKLRHQVQQAKTLAEFQEIIQTIEAEGPHGRDRQDQLPELTIPVPGGPNAHW